MTTYFSDQYLGSATASSQLAQDGTTLKISATRQYAPVRYMKCVVRNLPATDPVQDGDVLRLFPMKSGDVPLRILVSTKAPWTAATDMDIGIALKGIAHDGPLVHANAVDMLAGVVDIGSTLEEESVLANPGALMDPFDDLGKSLWEIANDRVTGLSYSTNPHQEWDLIGTITDVGGAGIINGNIDVQLWYTKAVS